MLLSTIVIGWVIVLEARPVYRIFMAEAKGWTLTMGDKVWITVSFALAFTTSILAIILPMRFGEKELAKRFE